jgi:hypothetical protein
MGCVLWNMENGTWKMDQIRQNIEFCYIYMFDLLHTMNMAVFGTAILTIDIKRHILRIPVS